MENVDFTTVCSAGREQDTLTKRHRVKMSRTWVPLLMGTIPLNILSFFCITEPFTTVCIHLIKDIFFNSYLLHAKHCCNWALFLKCPKWGNVSPLLASSVST